MNAATCENCGTVTAGVQDGLCSSCAIEYDSLRTIVLRHQPIPSADCFNQYHDTVRKTMPEGSYVVDQPTQFAVMGLVTAGAKLLDLVKQGKFCSGVQINEADVFEHLWLVMYYVQALCCVHGWTFESIIEAHMNRMKLELVSEGDDGRNGVT